MRILRALVYPLIVVLAFATGWLIGGTDAGRAVRGAATRVAGSALAEGIDADLRTRVLLENPELVPVLGDGFGGDFSPLVGQNMFSRDPEVIEAARELTGTVEVAPRTWLVRFPIVNAVVFETDDGLVVVDTGMAPAGPALLEAIREVSDSPVHTVIYTHGHVDHAYGTWALLEAGETPEIVAHRAIEARFDRYVRLRGSIARYMSQPVEQLPRSREDIAWPTRLFDDRLELEIGGERFVLVHHRGETDDQLYVWVPGRGALASADYYQGFLPNAGNGKRVQRHLEEWAVALREMVALEPRVLLPAHGDAITDPAGIRASLTALADALQHVVDGTIAGLNRGLRKDQVFASLELPPQLAGDPTLSERYVTVQDLSKMVIERYTGWWDDVPSDWSPALLEDQGREIVALAGGLERLAARSRELIGIDVRLASHLADHAFHARPDDPVAQQLTLDVYRARIMDPQSNTQERLAYLDRMIAARAAQLAN